MNAIVERRSSSSPVIAGFAVAIALHGLALLSFMAFDPPATSSVDTGEGGLIVMMGDAGGVTAQTVAESISAAEESGAPDGEAVEEVMEQTVALPVPDTPVTEVTETPPVEPVEMVEVEQVEPEPVETTEPLVEPLPQETEVAEAAEIVPVETVTAAIQPPPLPVTRPEPSLKPVEMVKQTRPVELVKPVETKVAEAKPVEVAPKQPRTTDAELADNVSDALKKKGSGVIDSASSAPNRAAGPGQTQASSGGGGAAGARKSYFASIQSWLERHKRYPRAARLRRYEGTVAFSFQIDRSGSIMKRSIVKSSGRKILDEALLDLLKRADPMPPMPPEIVGATFDFTTSIEYNLR